MNNKTFDEWYAELIDYLKSEGHSLSWFKLESVLDLNMFYEMEATPEDVEECLMEWYNE